MTNSNALSKVALACAATAVMLIGLAPAGAAGAQRQRLKQAETARPKPQRAPQASTRTETMDDIRANAQDPAGNYKDFPSWARSAFTNFPRD